MDWRNWLRGWRTNKSIPAKEMSTQVRAENLVYLDDFRQQLEAKHNLQNEPPIRTTAKRRMKLQMSERVGVLLDQTALTTGAEDTGKVIRDAIVLYCALVKSVEAGEYPFLRNKSGKEIPIFTAE